jgi:two-component system response regulator NreC
VSPPAQIHQDDVFRANRIRCILVHDHVLLRQGLRRLLEDEPDLEVVAEAGDAAEALQRIFECNPEIVIADPRTIGLPPRAAEALLLRESPKSRVLFLSANEPENVPSNPTEEAGSGCAVRQTSSEELVNMVRNACRNDAAGVREMPRRIQDDWSQPVPAAVPKRVLTTREREVLKLLAEGRTVRSAASVLGVSVKTVDAHKFNLMRKLGIHNKAELVMWAIQKRVVKIPANF